MVASHEAVEQIVTILLKHAGKKKARLLVRDLYHNVKGNQSLMQTLCRVAEHLEHSENEKETEAEKSGA
jgi:hypothetical protein